MQYGPYFKVTQGCYYIVINGSNLQSECTSTQVYNSSPFLEYSVLSKTISSTRIDYYVNIPNSLIDGSGIEMSLQNWCPEVTMTVDNITVYSRNNCPNS